MSQRPAPGQTLGWTGYFTAFVTQNTKGPNQHLRRRAYIEALRAS